MIFSFSTKAKFSPELVLQLLYLNSCKRVHEKEDGKHKMYA